MPSGGKNTLSSTDYKAGRKKKKEREKKAYNLTHSVKISELKS